MTTLARGTTMKPDSIVEAVKDEINKIDGMESADIRKLQKGLRNIPAGNMLSEIAHSMLSRAVKTQMEKQPLV